MNLYKNLKQDNNLEDGLARFEAINPAKSFIVQAPAGSGKTSLLTQRFLALLAVVESPEKIVAMTFTKKAVAEMQLRILEALQSCEQTSKTEILQQDLYAQNTWQLAKLALENNHQRGWNLLSNPHRLRIKSIDSFNSYLVQQMPLLSNVGGQLNIVKQPDALYSIAARETLNTQQVSVAVTTLMGLVNGDRRLAEKMIAMMLAKRDQWMPLLSSMQEGIDLAKFNHALSSLVEMIFNDLMINIEPALAKLQAAKLVLDEALSLPSLNFIKTDVQELATWQEFISSLLTAKGGILKRNKLPNKTKEDQEIKGRFQECLNEVEQNNYDGKVSAALSAIADLPSPTYSPQQWQGVQDLSQLLITAAAHLKVVFTQQMSADFIEISQGASSSLGEVEQPTDLAQRLDYQIQHLLIDEFQDTSVSQFGLLKKLIAGWSAEDNHSLFIVGDPMQSIYRFREAEVGNFLETWAGSIGDFALKQQQLTVNFRSKMGVVNWVNKTFKKIMPSKNIIERGGVSYSASTAFSQQDEQAITTHWTVNQSSEQAVNEIINTLQQILKNKKPNQTIGILGRSRSVLIPVIKELKVQKLAFRALEIEKLAQRQEVQDLESLTCSLIHLGDRAAWIALLRTPAIGLGLMDLSVLLENKATRNLPVWAVLKQHQQEGFSQLSEQGGVRLDKVYPVLENAIEHIGLLNWSRLIKETWLALDFAQSLNSASELQNIVAFWQMLTELELEHKGSFSKFDLVTSLGNLFALPDTSEQAKQIEIMTMHKAKGLEFDFVLLPELNKLPVADDKKLINWLNVKKAEQQHLIFAPMAQKGTKKGTKDKEADKRLVDFILNVEKQKQNYELGRVFYVACTRAKQQLHLFANVKYTEKQMNENKEIAPVKGSLLSVFWETQQQAFNKLAERNDFKEQDDELDSVPILVSRLPMDREHFINDFSGLNLAPMQQEPQEMELLKDGNTNINKDINQQTKMANMATSVGNLVHQMLELWGNQQSLPSEISQQLADYLKYWLQQQNIEAESLTEALDITLISLNNALKNKKIIWALTSQFKQSANELAISSSGLEFADKEKIESINHIVDRTFVDEQDTRWIVDYKTSYYSADMKISKQQFITEQTEKYKPQLDRYAQLFQQLENRKQILVLYFSYLDEWVEL
jgi:ATP-dependent exoDNAse (exonuclease V) beta subunit